MIKNTPGPWHNTGRPGKRAPVVAHVDGFAIAGVETARKRPPSPGHPNPEGECEANMRLILAAPEMIRLLKFAAARLNLEEQRNPGGVYILAAFREDINTVIANATVEFPVRRGKGTR